MQKWAHSSRAQLRSVDLWSRWSLQLSTCSCAGVTGCDAANPRRLATQSQDDPRAESQEKGGGERVPPFVSKLSQQGRLDRKVAGQQHASAAGRGSPGLSK